MDAWQRRRNIIYAPDTFMRARTTSKEGRKTMSRHSSDVFEEIAKHARYCQGDSYEGFFELAKLRLARIQSLINEAESRLCYESNCKQRRERWEKWLN